MGKKGFRKPIKSIRCPLCKYADIKLLGKRSDLTLLVNNYRKYVDNLNIFDRTIYKCQVCGLQFIHHMYNESDLNALYNQDGYQLFLKINRQINDFKSLKALKMLKIWKEEFVKLGILSWRKNFQKRYCRKPHFLDVGCGRGRNLIIFQELGFDVTGIDVSDIQINFVKENLGFNVIKTSLDDFEPNKRFDCILAANVIEHVTCPHMFIDKMINLLEHEALILIEIPLAEDDGNQQEKYRDIYHTLFFDHFTLGLLASMHKMQFLNSINKVWENGSFHVRILASFKKNEELSLKIIAKPHIENLRSSYDALLKDFLESTRDALILQENLLNRAWKYWRKHGLISTTKKTLNFILIKIGIKKPLS